MPNGYPAFQVGEHVKFAYLATLRKAQEELGVNGPLGRKWIHDILSDDMTVHLDDYVRIKEVSIYHMGTILYKFDEVGHWWLEQCIVDRSLMEPSEHDLDCPAIQFYEAVTDCESDVPGIVCIRSRHDHEIFCSLRRNFPKDDARKINDICSLRTKANFEDLYGFEGHYDRIPENSGRTR